MPSKEEGISSNLEALQGVLSAGQEDLDVRLDKWLSLKFPQCSRTYFQSLIEKGSVLINGIPCKKRQKLQLADEVEVCFELTPELSLEPENIPLDVLYEDEDLLAINKPPGMVVHPAPGHAKGTFVNALLYYCRSLAIDSLRPGIVHRLDKDTSGVLLAAKNSHTHRALIELFSNRKVEKYYYAICLGTPQVSEIDAPIKRHPVKRQQMAVCPTGKPATTQIQILKQGKGVSFLKIRLITGRTHQIRVHLKHIGHPILGDPVYGRSWENEKWGVYRQMLHAYSIGFVHPSTQKKVEILAPIPQDMAKICEELC